MKSLEINLKTVFFSYEIKELICVCMKKIIFFAVIIKDSIRLYTFFLLIRH